jgi:hypothetical protein
VSEDWWLFTINDTKVFCILNADGGVLTEPDSPITLQDMKWETHDGMPTLSSSKPVIEFSYFFLFWTGVRIPSSPPMFSSGAKQPLLFRIGERHVSEHVDA